ncbi:MAG: DUF799 family lipoprotein [Syntrophales bacterium]|nr:DUF799 family lipoprotein [Syntrophales bacterium]
MMNNADIGKKKLCILLSLAVLLCISLNACAPAMVTKGDKFPLMYEETPASILILPPMNESTAAEAKDYYATTIQEPLSFWGYYVFPYEITTEILKMEGIYDTELLKTLPLQKFREYFGTDAVLFTTIKKWNLVYMVLAANLTVSIDCELKSTKSNATLWQYNGTVIVDLSGGSSGGGVAGLIAKAIVTAINSSMADYVPHARRANYIPLRTLPYGKYHRLYGQDQAQRFREQKPRKEE